MTVTGHSTAVGRMKLSRPMRHLVENNYLSSDGEYRDTLDYGCGKGDDIRGLLVEGIPCHGYDPHHRNETWILNWKWDVVTCIYVANVLGRKEANGLIGDIQEILKPSGICYMAIRNDLPETGRNGRGCTQTPWKLKGAGLLHKSAGFYLYSIRKEYKCIVI